MTEGLSLSEARFAGLGWKEFESHVIDLLTRLYAPHGLTIVQTPYSNDGGRDGHACLTIGPQASSGDVDGLEISIKVWAEVKKRSSGVDLEDIGGHFILAVDAKVNKLLFITNSHFTDRSRRSCRSVAEKNNIQVSFIDGEALHLLERRLAEARERVDIGQGLEPAQPAPDVLVRTRLSVSADGVGLPPSEIMVDCGDVFYMIVDIEAGPRGEPLRVTLTQTEPAPGLTVTPLGATAFILDVLGGGQRSVFAVWADRAGAYGFDEMGVTISSSEPNSSLVFEHLGGVRVHRSILTSTLPTRRRTVVDDAERLAARVGKDAGVACLLLEADAGAGKSHLLRALRKRLLKAGRREIHMDGETHRDLGSMMRALVCHASPLTDEVLAHLRPEAFDAWMSSASAGAIDARGYACLRDILEGRADAESLDTAVWLAATALIDASRAGPIIVTFEDAHKANPSILNFVRRLIGLLALQKKGAVLFVLTSRPSGEMETLELRAQWERSFRALGDGQAIFVQVFVPVLGDDDALGLLQESVHGLTRNDALAVIQQVGTNPFRLREALNYLHGAGVVAVSPQAGARLVDMRGLAKVLDSPVLRSATQERLKLFTASQPEWIGRFLLLAACYGRSFASGTTRAALGLAVEQLEALYAPLERYEILRAPNLPDRPEEDLAFDHDLIRDAVLMNAGGLAITAAAATLAPHLTDVDPPHRRLTVLLLANQLDAAADLADRRRQDAQGARNHIEAFQFALAHLYAMLGRADVFPANGFLQPYMADLDRALLYGRPPRRSRRSDDLEDATPFLHALEQMIATGMIADELALRLISLGAMQAETARDLTSRSRLHYFEGRRLFDQGDYQAAYEQFAAVERTWPAGPDARAPSLSDARVRSAICERHLGRKAQAHATIMRALSLRSGVDWSLFLSVAANLGAFEMYANPDAATRYWRKGLWAANHIGDMRHVAHFTNDLAHLDLMAGAFAAAVDRVEAAMAVARRHGATDELLRGGIFLGCLALAGGDLAAARGALAHAEEQAAAHASYRRLWRVRANIATIEELANRPRDALLRDLQAVDGMPPVEETLRLAQHEGRHTRELGALINIVWRASANPDLYAELRERFAPSVWRHLSQAAEDLDAGGDAEVWIGPMDCLLHPVGDGDRRRFLITE